jgi:surface protein
MKTLRIFTDNYSGYTGDITFYPYTGGTINIGPQVLPYDYNTHYYYGTYDIYFSVFNKTCTLNYFPPACDFSGSVNSTSFISTWRTDEGGFTGPDQIGIVLDYSGTFDFVIDWGDGNTDTITDPFQSELIHTYDVIGTYTITMTGVIDGFDMRFFSGDYGKILSIQQWGNVKLPDGGYQFYYCYNLDLSTVNDVLDTSNLMDISAMFADCNSLTSVNNIELWDVSNIISMNSMFYNTQFNSPLSGWNVSSVTDMAGMFYLSLFNQPLSNWERTTPDISTLSNVINMSYMLYDSQFNQDIGNWDISNVSDFFEFMGDKTPLTFSTTNLDSIYNGWSSLPSLQSGINISFGSANYTTSGGQAGKDILIGTYGWTITDGGGI